MSQTGFNTGFKYADVSGMYIVHTMIRREFALLPGLVRDVAPADRDRAQVVADHIRLLSLIVHEHHCGEDAVLWPNLLIRAPKETHPAIHRVEGQHEGIDALSSRIDALLATWLDSGAGDCGDDLAYGLEQLAAALNEHMSLEEKLMLPLVERHIFASEWDGMVERGAARIPADLGPVVVGMLMYEGGRNAVPPELHDAVAPVARPAYAAHCRAVHGTATPRRSDGAVGTLELISKGSGSAAHQTPILFVHGAWHAAWCWDEGFLDFFADKGYRALALSLRGHGASPAPKALHRLSIADYVDDVVAVAGALSTPPVVIGHSMGGFIVQKYLESRSAPVAVLLASIPPRGDAKALMRFMRQHPWRTLKGLATVDTTVAFNSPALAREQFFSPDTSESDVIRHVPRFQQESRRALYVDTAFLHLPKPDRVATPLMVLGAERDGIVTPEEVHATARAYKTKAEIFPEMGHDMMLEPGWRDVAERIHAWLTNRGI